VNGPLVHSASATKDVDEEVEEVVDDLSEELETLDVVDVLTLVDEVLAVVEEVLVEDVFVGELVVFFGARISRGTSSTPTASRSPTTAAEATKPMARNERSFEINMAMRRWKRGLRTTRFFERFHVSISKQLHCLHIFRVGTNLVLDLRSIRSHLRRERPVPRKFQAFGAYSSPLGE
jgi:hypothetical protein